MMIDSIIAMMPRGPKSNAWKDRILLTGRKNVAFFARNLSQIGRN